MKLLGSIHARLLLPLTAAILVLCGLAIYNAFLARAMETRQTQMTALRLAKHIAINQGQYIQDARQLLTLVAQLSRDELIAGGPPCDRALAAIRRSHTQYANIGVIALDGKATCSALPFGEPLLLDHRAYFRRALETGEFAVGDYQIGLITGRSSLNAGYPLRDAAGNIERVVFVALDLGWLSQNLSKTPLPSGTVTTIVSGDGTILARYPDGGLIGKPFGEGYILPTLSSAEVSTGNFTTAEGELRLFASALMPAWNGDPVRVIVSIPSQAAYGATDALFWRQIIGLLLVSLLAGGVAWWWARRLVLGPLEALTRASQQISSGNLKARVSLNLPLREMALLASSFDAMADSLEERYHKIEQQDVELLRINRALQTLSAGNHALLRAVDEEALLKDMCQVTVAVGGYRLAWVGYAQGDRAKSIRPMAQAGLAGDLDKKLPLSWGETLAGTSPAGLAIRTAKPVVTKKSQADPNAGPWLAFFQRYDLQSSISLPLVVNGQAIGAITIYANEEGAFDSREQAILEEMSQDLAFGIHILRTRLEKEEAERTIRHLAYHDPLTDLPNYRQLEAWLNDELNNSPVENHRLALLNIGMDRLRDINVSLGYDIGNRVLKETGFNISQQLWPGEQLARLQGDEFAVYLPGAGTEEAQQRAREILAIADGQPFLLTGFTLPVRARVGIALYPDHGTTAGDLIQQAGTAMQLAKENKVAYALYSPKADKQKKYLLELAGKLNEALEHNELALFYQPKICMNSGRVLGVESLARWHHPENGVIPPDVFIQVAENTGMIHRLSRWVLEAALRQSHHWREKGIHLPVAINLSPQDVHDDDLVDYIEEIAGRWQLEPGLLDIEITESAIMEDPESARKQMTRLRAMGISLYIDDFGTGFSSLASLKKLPFDALKIDKSFVMDMLTDPDAKVIVNSTITLAHELNLSVVAEGVETKEIWAELKTLGCNTAQGYFMAKPMPTAALETWLRESSWGLGSG
jgi:diguanylate cyclase